MPRRRRRARNPDGSLVTPLSPAQLATLEKGRRALAARIAAGEAGTKANEAGTKEKPQRTRVRSASFEKGAKTKAKPPDPPASPSPTSEGQGKSRLERWLSET